MQTPKQSNPSQIQGLRLLYFFLGVKDGIISYYSGRLINQKSRPNVLTSGSKLPGVFITVVEKPDYPDVSETLYLAFKGIHSLRVDPADIGHLKNIPFVCKILVCFDLVFLICSVVVEHTDLHRDYSTVCLVLAYHIYVLVSVCAHNIPIRILPISEL